MTHFVDYLDEQSVEISDAPLEPWGKYDLLVCLFAVATLFIFACGVLAFILKPTLAVLLAFILLAVASGLFAVTFDHRRQTSKYRSHLADVEKVLSTRTLSLRSTSMELQALKRSLTTVRDDLIRKTQSEVDHTRRQIAQELDAAKDQHNAIHRMAERFLSETQKWWIAKLTGQNFQITKERMQKAIDFCRKQGYPVSPTHEREIFKQLKLDYEEVLRREHEKAEQARIRELMREEQRVQRELNKELERKRQETIRRQAEQHAIERALKLEMQKVGAEHSAEVLRLNGMLAEAQQRVLEAQEAARRTQSQAELTRVGNVYVISNVGSFGENGFKVGLTRRLDPLDRVRELGDASVPFPFDVHMMIRSDDAPTLEKKLHRELHNFRMNRVNFRKEFFRVDLQTIRNAVQKHHGNIEYEYPGSAEETEYEQSLKISAADFAFLEAVAEKAGLEDDDDDTDGLDEHLHETE